MFPYSLEKYKQSMIEVTPEKKLPNVGPANLLPADALREIFSFCDPIVKQDASMVCKSWNQVVIEQVHFELKDPLNFMKDSICTVLKEQKYLDKKNRCVSNIQEILSLKPDNRLQIKNCLTKGRDDLAFELKNLEGDLIANVISCCESKKMPFVFEKFGTLAEAYKLVDQANSNPYQRDEELNCVVKKLYLAGIFDKAFMVAKMIVDDEERDLSLMGMVEHLAKHGNIDQALLVYDAIDEEEYGYYARGCIAVAEAKNRDLDQALVIIQELPKKHQSRPLGKIAEQWAHLDIEKALFLINMCHDSSFAVTALKTIVDALIQSDEYDRAIEVAKKIPMDCAQSSTIEKIEDARFAQSVLCVLSSYTERDSNTNL